MVSPTLSTCRFRSRQDVRGRGPQLPDSEGPERRPPLRAVGQVPACVGSLRRRGRSRGHPALRGGGLPGRRARPLPPDPSGAARRVLRSTLRHRRPRLRGLGPEVRRLPGFRSRVPVVTQRLRDGPGRGARVRGLRDQPRVPEPREPVWLRQLGGASSNGPKSTSTGDGDRSCPGRAYQLSNLSLSTSLRLSATGSLFASYDSRRNYRAFWNRDVPENIFDDLLHQGLRAGFNHGGACGASVSGSFGLRFKETSMAFPELDSANSYSVNANVRHGNLWASRLSAGLDVSGFKNAYTEGALLSGRLGRSFRAGHLLELAYGYSLYRVQETREDRSTQWFRLVGRGELTRKVYLSARPRVRHGRRPQGAPGFPRARLPVLGPWTRTSSGAWPCSWSPRGRALRPPLPPPAALGPRAQGRRRRAWASTSPPPSSRSSIPCSASAAAPASTPVPSTTSWGSWAERPWWSTASSAWATAVRDRLPGGGDRGGPRRLEVAARHSAHGPVAGDERARPLRGRRGRRASRSCKNAVSQALKVVERIARASRPPPRSPASGGASSTSLIVGAGPAGSDRRRRGRENRGSLTSCWSRRRTSAAPSSTTRGASWCWCRAGRHAPLGAAEGGGVREGGPARDPPGAHPRARLDVRFGEKVTGGRARTEGSSRSRAPRA